MEKGPAPLLSALSNLVCPGLGYLTRGLYGHALVSFLSVFTFVVFGMLLGGRLYSLLDRSEGMLAIIFALCDMGTGLVYFLMVQAGVATADRSYLATSEYGNVFFMTAGLINYLQVLDVYDLSTGRKR